jgi:hypothetical protein
MNAFPRVPITGANTLSSVRFFGYNRDFYNRLERWMNQADERCRRGILPPVILALLGMLVTAAMWNGLQLYGHSAEVDYFRMVSFDRMIRAGVLYPRWDPDTYFGYGSPLFNFYAPLSYYLTEVSALFGVPLHSAIKITLVFALILSGLGMYLFCRDFAGRFGSFLAGFAYMLAPYHMVDMVVRHALGEHVAFAFIPFACWGVSGMVKGRRPLRLAVGAFAMAALILSHNITAMLSIGALALWWLILIIRSRTFSAIIFGASIFVLGLLVSLFFWAPAMAEKSLIFAKESLTQGYFDYSNHFVYVRQLFKMNWGFGGSLKGPDDSMSFQVGVPHLLFVAAGIATLVFLLVRRRKEGNSIDKDQKDAIAILVFAGTLFVLAVFFALPLSSFFYRIIPVLKYVQFPWRLLVFVSFASSVAAVSLEILAKNSGKQHRIPAIAITGTIFIFAFYVYYAIPRFSYFSVDKGMFYSGRAFQVEKQLSNPQVAKNIWQIDPLQYMLTSGISCTSGDDYLPRTVHEKPQAKPEKPMRWRGQGQPEILYSISNPVDLLIRINNPEPGTLEVLRFSFPGWQASVDGKLVKTGIRSATGTIEIPLSAGFHEIRVYFGTTPLRTISGWISAVCLLFLFLVPVITLNRSVPLPWLLRY